MAGNEHSMSPTPRSQLPKGHLRLEEFRVDGLFGEFNYVIPLNLERHVTAIISPNGTGKTLCLRLIHGLFANKWSIYSSTEFDKITFSFTGGAQVIISKPNQSVANSTQTPPPLTISTKSTADAEGVEWTPRISEARRAIQIERFLPFITRLGVDRWRDDRTGDSYTYDDFIESHADFLPDQIRLRLYREMPTVLSDITANIDCRLIETQRLLILKEDVDEPPYQTKRKPKSALAIARKSQQLREIISSEINAYASLSQSLDRSFPKRVIAHSTRIAPEKLKAQLADLDVKRKALMEAGILDTEADDPLSLPSGSISNEIASVLSVYVEDNDKKLSSLSHILAKIRLFKELIDDRFLTKDVRISRQSGMTVSYKSRNVPLENLSSGEQHQLVLFFELLFEIDKSSLILIDEPELSLHVAWQKKFIGDLLKIIHLNKFDVVLATHSPQLVGRWNDLVVELGDVFEGRKKDGDEAADE